MAQVQLVGDDGKVMGNWPVYEKTFSTGNTGYQANGEINLGGAPHNVNIIFARKKAQGVKKVAVLGAAKKGGLTSNTK